MKRIFLPSLQRIGMFEELEASAGTYDPDAMTYDPDAEMYSGKNPNNPQRTRQKASFDLVMTNVTGEKLTIELFNEMRSFVENRNPAIITSATVLYTPQTSFEGLAAAGSGVIGFNQNGDLRATGAAAATALTVVCPQYTYRALLKSSARRPFRIIGIRMTVQTDAQIDNEIVHFSSNFLGARQENTLNPRTFFNPQQFQSKIVDIQCAFSIDDQKGLQYTINANETVKFNILIER